MKVGVIAGTKVDTKMGAEILNERGFKTYSYPMSNTPQEQTQQQYFSQLELEELFEKNAKSAIAEGAEKIFVYCNSLSSAVNYKEIEKRIGIPIITPLETYMELPKEIKNIFIVAANGISAYKIDRLITENNRDVNTVTMGNLPVVYSIEEGSSPTEIINKLNISGLIKYLEGINDERYKIDAILLGCTHFPYLKKELEKLTELRIIDPAEDMIRRLSI